MAEGSQVEREVRATEVNILEAKATLHRVEAARCDIEANLHKTHLEQARYRVELEKNTQARIKAQADLAAFEAKRASYPPTTLVT